MRVKQVDSWNGQRERILDDEKKRAEAYSFVQRISRRAHPVPSRGFLSFLRPIDYPRYYLLSRLSTVSLRTCGLSLSRERKKMAYLGRFQRPDAATSPKGIINRARPPARGFAFFFTLFSFLLLSS